MVKRFEIAPHTITTDQSMVECFDARGNFIAAIYARDDGIRVVSKFFNKVDVEADGFAIKLRGVP